MVTADELARRYRAYLHAQLTGDDAETIDFGLWLDAHWVQFGSPGFPACLDDIDGVREAGITWVEQDREVLGLLAGNSFGFYRIGTGEMVPIVALYLDDDFGCSTGSAIQERWARPVASPPALRPIDFGIPAIAQPEADTPLSRPANPPLMLPMGHPGANHAP